MCSSDLSVGYVSRFLQRPTTEHEQTVKRIIRYVAGTLDHGLYYPRCPGEVHLVGYSDSDSDNAGDIDTSKSTSGILFFLGKCLISWQSVKQQKSIEPYETERVAKIRERITDALEKTISVDYDKNRLEQELIYYIEKLDINERCV